MWTPHAGGRNQNGWGNTRPTHSTNNFSRSGPVQLSAQMNATGPPPPGYYGTGTPQKRQSNQHIRTNLGRSNGRNGVAGDPNRYSPQKRAYIHQKSPSVPSISLPASQYGQKQGSNSPQKWNQPDTPSRHIAMPGAGLPAPHRTGGSQRQQRQTGSINSWQVNARRSSSAGTGTVNQVHPPQNQMASTGMGASLRWDNTEKMSKLHQRGRWQQPQQQQRIPAAKSGDMAWGSPRGGTPLQMGGNAPHMHRTSPLKMGTRKQGPILEVGVADDPNPRFRPTMEDSHVAIHGFGNSHYKHGVNRPDNNNTGYFAVYDGHGGREAVDFIEHNLHRNLDRELGRNQAPDRAMEAAFLNTDAAMSKQRKYQQCGSTVAAALVRPSESREGGRELYVANVGDARAVMAVAHNGQLQADRLTRDHNPTTPREIERVRRCGGAVYNGRVNGMLAVSRALGDHALKASGVTGLPHQNHVPLHDDHKFMIVACDGLWDVVTDDEAVQAVKNVRNPHSMAKRLVDLAMKRGTTDNVSVMAIRLQDS